MNTRWSGLVLTILVAVVMATADDVKKSMIAVIPVQTGDKGVNLMPPSELRACDWRAASTAGGAAMEAHRPPWNRGKCAIVFSVGIRKSELGSV